MENSMIVNRQITFPHEKLKVWELLTNPEITKQYMFGCEVLSNWKKGDAITWKGPNENGEIITYVVGEITDILVGERVSFTMFDPNTGIADIPANYVNLTYELKEVEEGTQLLIIQGDFLGVEKAQSRYDDTVKGWDMVLPLMKKTIAQL